MMWVPILFLGGLILIFLEVYLPGGILGSIGGGMIFASMILSYRYYPNYAPFIIGGEILLTGFVLYFWVKTFHTTRMGKKLILDQSLPSVESNLQKYVGKEGITLTPLRPVGIAQIAGERIPAKAEGMFIGKGKRVQVIGFSGKEVIVKEMKEKEGENG